MQATLEHAVCKLVPLTQAHAHGLANVAGSTAPSSDGKSNNLWCNKFLHIPQPNDVPSYIDRALNMQAMGRELPFVILSKQGTVLGTTRFQTIAINNRRADIGSTWIAHLAQGQAVNAVCKQLMLKHAFETMGLQRVGFTVHPDNQRSRAALEAIGASFEGVLRQWQNLHGVPTDMCSYSILAQDWSLIRKKLDHRIAEQVTRRPIKIEPACD